MDSDCGSPELPPGSVVEESSPERMVVSCVEGLHLNTEADSDSDNVTSLVCSDGSWNSTNLRCQRESNYRIVLTINQAQTKLQILHAETFYKSQNLPSIYKL